MHLLRRATASEVGVRPPVRAGAFRVGLIGYGLAGSSFHAPFIAVTPGLQLAAIVTSNPDRQKQARQDHPDARVVAAADELWGMRDLDLIVVASPNRTHVPLARAAVDAGLAVVVDKPLAATATEAAQLIAEAERRGVPLAVFQNRRWDGDFLTVRRLLQNDQLGRVLRFESRFERWRPEPKPGWRELAAPEEAGGLLYDLGSHLVDQALVLFGPADSVYAELDRRRAGVEVDDDTFVALSHASGVRSHLFMSTVAAQSGPRMRVLGTRAAYTKFGLDVQEQALRAGQRPDRADWGAEQESNWGQIGCGPDVRSVRTEPGAYQAFYSGIVLALRGGPLPVDPHDAVAALRVLEAARVSSTERSVVMVR
jgi:predicted dehydrogenase